VAAWRWPSRYGRGLIDDFDTPSNLLYSMSI